MEACAADCRDEVPCGVCVAEWCRKNKLCFTCWTLRDKKIPGVERVDNGLPAGIHCDECYDGDPTAIFEAVRKKKK